MALEVFAALFHFDEHDGFPDVIRKGNAAAILIGFADAELGLPAYVERAGLAKGLKEPVEEDLRLTLLVAGDVFGASRGEFGEFFPARHGGVLPESGRRWKIEDGAWRTKPLLKPAMPLEPGALPVGTARPR